MHSVTGHFYSKSAAAAILNKPHQPPAWAASVSRLRRSSIRLIFTKIRSMITFKVNCKILSFYDNQENPDTASCSYYKIFLMRASNVHVLSNKLDSSTVLQGGSRCRLEIHPVEATITSNWSGISEISRPGHHSDQDARCKEKGHSIAATITSGQPAISATSLPGHNSNEDARIRRLQKQIGLLSEPESDAARATQASNIRAARKAVVRILSLVFDPTQRDAALHT